VYSIKLSQNNPDGNFDKKSARLVFTSKKQQILLEHRYYAYNYCLNLRLNGVNNKKKSLR